MSSAGWQGESPVLFFAVVGVAVAAGVLLAIILEDRDR